MPTLWDRVRDASAHALTSGALQPIETTVEVVPDSGVEFSIRKVSSLLRKEEHRRAGERRSGNPFLPYEPEMFVADLSPTHVALLNKFPVFPHHVLIVTRAFEDQESPLDEADFDALAAALAEIDGLAFYNSGRVAGASQPHKHLQLVPVPLGAGEAAIPIEALFPVSALEQRCAALPFEHALTWLPAEERLRPDRRAGALLACYRSLLESAPRTRARGAALPPYNLLVTRRWMLLVPRRTETFAGVSVNALGFAGSLLVRDDAQLATLETARPMSVLRAVAFER